MENTLAKEKKPLYLLPRLALIITLLSAGGAFLASCLDLLNGITGFLPYSINWDAVTLVDILFEISFAACFFLVPLIMIFMTHKAQSAEKYPRWLAIPALMLAGYYTYPFVYQFLCLIFGEYSSFESLGSLVNLFLNITFNALPLLILAVFLLMGKKKNPLLVILAMIPLALALRDNALFPLEYIMGVLDIQIDGLGYQFYTHRYSYYGYSYEVYSWSMVLHYLSSFFWCYAEVWALVATVLFLIPGKKKVEAPAEDAE